MGWEKRQKELTEITSKDIKRYLIIEFAAAPEATKERKTASLKRFFTWAKEENKIAASPIEEYLKDTVYIRPIKRLL